VREKIRLGTRSAGLGSGDSTRPRVGTVSFSAPAEISGLINATLATAHLKKEKWRDPSDPRGVSRDRQTNGDKELANCEHNQLLMSGMRHIQ